MKIILTFLLFLWANSLFSQDTKPDTITIPFDTNKIYQSVKLSGTSETFSYNKFIWDDKRTLSEIFVQLPGNYTNFFSEGGRNTLNINGFNEKNIGIFRDGIQVNDNFFGGFDEQNIAVNEIDTIEQISNVSSFLYGINTQGKSINIITKDVFQPLPFSQLRFSQDRDNSLLADVYFSQSFSNKINAQFGATNRSLDGFYANSDFSVWKARSKLNFFLSPKFNAKLYFYYSKIQRGLNEGLVSASEDSLRNPDLAQVVNSDSYEKLTNYYYGLSLTGRFLKNKKSLTTLSIYSNNSLREYRDEENRTNPNGTFQSNNFHSIVYGIDLKQNIRFSPARDWNLDLLTGGNAYFNLFKFDRLYSSSSVISAQLNYYTYISKLDLTYKNFYLSVFGKLESMNAESYTLGGIESHYTIPLTNDIDIKIFGGTNFINGGIDYNYLSNYSTTSTVSNIYDDTEKRYTEAGAELSTKNFNFKFYQYGISSPGSIELSNGNYEARFLSKYIDIDLALNYLTPGSASNDFAQYYLKSGIEYHDFFFDNNLDFRTGFNIRYINKLTPYAYSQYTYTSVAPAFPYTTATGPSSDTLENAFNMDFYVGGRIGSANIIFTIANIFDNFVYDTYLFPWENRGGALNAISRFTIVWDFLN